MTETYQNVRKINQAMVPSDNMRTAAFVDAIHKVGFNYQESGVFA